MLHVTVLLYAATLASSDHSMYEDELRVLSIRAVFDTIISAWLKEIVRNANAAAVSARTAQFLLNGGKASILSQYATSHLQLKTPQFLLPGEELGAKAAADADARQVRYESDAPLVAATPAAVAAQKSASSSSSPAANQQQQDTPRLASAPGRTQRVNDIAGAHNPQNSAAAVHKKRHEGKTFKIGTLGDLDGVWAAVAMSFPKLVLQPPSLHDARSFPNFPAVKDELARRVVAATKNNSNAMRQISDEDLDVMENRLDKVK
jgi:hypothetical protein